VKAVTTIEVTALERRPRPRNRSRRVLPVNKVRPGANEWLVVTGSKPMIKPKSKIKKAAPVPEHEDAILVPLFPFDVERIAGGRIKEPKMGTIGA
jgi:hypothetical protein